MGKRLKDPRRKATAQQCVGCCRIKADNVWRPDLRTRMDDRYSPGVCPACKAKFILEHLRARASRVAGALDGQVKRDRS